MFRLPPAPVGRAGIFNTLIISYRRKYIRKRVIPNTYFDNILLFYRKKFYFYRTL